MSERFRTEIETGEGRLELEGLITFDPLIDEPGQVELLSVKPVGAAQSWNVWALSEKEDFEERLWLAYEAKHRQEWSVLVEAEKLGLALIASVRLGLSTGRSPEQVREYLGSIRSALLNPTKKEAA
jgi:hypothetical protein